MSFAQFVKAIIPGRCSTTLHERMVCPKGALPSLADGPLDIEGISCHPEALRSPSQTVPLLSGSEQASYRKCLARVSRDPVLTMSSHLVVNSFGI